MVVFLCISLYVLINIIILLEIEIFIKLYCAILAILNKKKVTLSIDSRIYDSYRDFCEENGLLLSKKIGIFMKKEMDDGKIKADEITGKKRN